MILILTSPKDQHANHLEPMLRARGAEVARFDPAEFPREAEVTLSLSPAGATRYALRTGATEIDLGAVSAVWLRRPGRPVPHDAITAAPTRAFVEQECAGFLQDVWSTLACRWLPAAPFVVRAATPKAMQLTVAGALGFELPPTLVSNRPEELVAFYREHNGQVISKLAGAALHETVSDTFIRYTEMVSRRDIAHARALRYAPVIFQAYVPKRVELRITVVGRRVFAAEIHSQATNHTRLDWRRYDHAHTPMSVHALPAAVEARCVALVERLGLRYGAIDMVLTPDGRYVFIEINPNGQYLWIEQDTGLPISDALCDLLISGSPQ